MISVTEALRAYLVADASIAALVAARVYPKKLPQTKLGFPAVVVSRISGQRLGHHLRGVAGLGRPRYQVDAWDTTFQGAQRLGSLCRQRLDGFAGTWSDDESPATEVRVSVFFEDEMDLFEDEIGGGLHRYSADYFVFHGTAGGTV